MNAIKLFNIKNVIVSLFRNGSIISLDYRSTIKLESEPKFKESTGERTKLRKQNYNKIAESEKDMNN